MEIKISYYNGPWLTLSSCIWSWEGGNLGLEVKDTGSENFDDF